jgi:hypothetical protein
MSLEDGRVSLPQNTTRPHLIIGMDKRGFFLAMTILVLSAMVPHDVRVTIGGVSLAVCIILTFRALGEHAPYALDEVQRFMVLPRWGAANASVHAPHRFTPYPRERKDHRK